MGRGRRGAGGGWWRGAGGGREKELGAGNVHAQIKKMRELYDALPEKPEWLTAEAIDRYAAQMAAPLEGNYLFCINPALEPFSDADFRNDLKAFVSGETEVLSDAGLPHMTLSVCETDYPLLCYATALCERLTAAGADVTLKQYSETMLRSRAINGRYQLLLVSENTLDATALPDADILLLSAEEMEDPSCEN